METNVYRMDNAIINRASNNKFFLDWKFQFTQPLSTNFINRSAPTDARWTVRFESRTMANNVFNALETFYNEVMADSGYFTMYDPVHQIPKGKPFEEYNDDECFTDATLFSDNLGFANSGGGAKLMVKPNAGDEYITLTNLQPMADVLRTGDHIQILHWTTTTHHDPMVGRAKVPMIYQVAENVCSDASGNVTVKIKPRIRSNTINLNDEVSFVRCRSVFQFLNDFDTTRLPVDRGSGGFTAVEVPEIINFPNVRIQGI